jgi:hypothetical protein
MQHAIDLVKKIREDLSKDWKEELVDYDMPSTFLNLYSLENYKIANTIICFIVYAYSPESLWLDLRKDRLENKIKILSNMNAETGNKIFQDLVNNKHEKSNMAIFDFLEGLKNWKWRAIFDLLDYSSKMFRFATQETESGKSSDKMNKAGEKETLVEEFNIDTISKVNKEKGIILDQAIAKRKQADDLFEEIRKDFVATDNATKSDFNFTFTDTAKKRDIMSWRDFIKKNNEDKNL